MVGRSSGGVYFAISCFLSSEERFEFKGIRNFQVSGFQVCVEGQRVCGFSF